MAIYEGEIFICKVLKRNFKKCEKRRQLGGIHKMDTELSRKSDIKSYSLDNLTKHFYIYAKCELKLFSPKTSKKCESWILGGGFFFTLFSFFVCEFFFQKAQVPRHISPPNKLTAFRWAKECILEERGRGRWSVKA